MSSTLVNWARVNKHFLKNLPAPDLFPILGVEQDPEFYTATRVDYTGKQVIVFTDSELTGGCPFGQMHGFQTDQGIVSMPEVPIHGYIWSYVDATWVIAARTC